MKKKFATIIRLLLVAFIVVNLLSLITIVKPGLIENTGIFFIVDILLIAIVCFVVIYSLKLSKIVEERKEFKDIKKSIKK